jgi:hypothetical protein
MAMRRALAQAMGRAPDGDTVQRLEDGGFMVLDEDTMSGAIHNVYCGIMADHADPNDKDREQAKALIKALRGAP